MASTQHKQIDSVSRPVFYVSQYQNGKTYYAQSDQLQLPTVVTWTSNRSKALQFFTEAGVYYYIRSRMPSRPGIFLTNAVTEI